MGLRRGFKTEANALAREVRADLGLAASDPLDPWKLAEFLEIPVQSLSSLRDVAPAAVRHFQLRDMAAFSAVTVFRGSSRWIWHNDAHAPQRQASNLSHELAHALLLHPPGSAINEIGARDWDTALEAEASWLGPALLISEEAALEIARRETSASDAAVAYGVSTRLVSFRLAAVGANRRVQRARAIRPIPTNRTPSHTV